MNSSPVVLFDHQAFSWQKFGGITRYIVELMNNLPADVTPTLPPMLTENVYLKELQRGRPSTTEWSFANYRVRKKLYEALNTLSTLRAISSRKPDILHPTYYNPYFLRRRKLPYAITVHDFTHERFPDMLPDSKSVIRNKKRTVMEADAIIAISENTKRDILEYYGLPEERITVIHHGYTVFSPKDEIPVNNLPGQYILFVGERGGYKNFDTFAKGFAILSHERPDIKLVAAGKPLTQQESELLRSLGILDKTVTLFAEPRQLSYLYRKAECFVYPSLYEGFGLPILEAFSTGCPVLLSRASCFPEIAGDAAAYFDPADPADMAETMRRVVNSPREQHNLVTASQRRLADFSWEKTAQATAQVYKSIIS